MDDQARLRLPRGRFVRGRQEPIPLAADGLNESRVAIVVLKLDAQAADMTIHDVALGHEINAPDRVEDLVATEHAAASACQQVEQALLGRAQGDDQTSSADLTTDDVD